MSICPRPQKLALALVVLLDGLLPDDSSRLLLGGRGWLLGNDFLLLAVAG